VNSSTHNPSLAKLLATVTSGSAVVAVAALGVALNVDAARLSGLIRRRPGARPDVGVSDVGTIAIKLE
jgi:hypothetical protein